MRSRAIDYANEEEKKLPLSWVQMFGLVNHYKLINLALYSATFVVCFANKEPQKMLDHIQCNKSTSSLTHCALGESQFGLSMCFYL